MLTLTAVLFQLGRRMQKKRPEDEPGRVENEDVEPPKKRTYLKLSPSKSSAEVEVAPESKLQCFGIVSNKEVSKGYIPLNMKKLLTGHWMFPNEWRTA